MLCGCILAFPASSASGTSQFITRGLPTGVPPKKKNTFKGSCIWVLGQSCFRLASFEYLVTPGEEGISSFAQLDRLFVLRVSGPLSYA